MTRQMYESLAVKDLRDIAKRRGIKIPAGTKKEGIIELMIAQDTADSTAAHKAQQASAANAAAAAGEQPQETGRGRGKRQAPEQEARTDKPKTGRGRRKTDKKADADPAEKDTAPVEQAAAKAPVSGQEEALPATPAETQVQTESTGTGREETPAQSGENAGPRTRRRVIRKETKGNRLQGTRPQTNRAQENRSGENRGQENKNPEARPQESRTLVVRNAQPAPARPVQESPASGESRVMEAPAVEEAGPRTETLDEKYARLGLQRPDAAIPHKNEINKELDSGELAHGILEVMADGYGFIRSANYMPGESDVYVAPSQIRRFNLKTGDIIEGNIRVKTQGEKFSALLFVKSINGYDPEDAKRRGNFEDMTPIFPEEKIRLEKAGAPVAMRVMDLMCPVGKGQRGMIVSPPKAGKTTLMKQVATSVKSNNPEIHLIILLIDERPEEVTDIREAIEGPNVEVIYSTFDETPEHHKRVAEMTIERARRLVEHKRDVMILLDSITRLTRAYNLTEAPSGRTLSGGLDPAALHMPKKFFGAARNMREGGSLTILATALIDTGSKMDDVVYEEFKGTGNMEMILDRKLSERRIFPAIDMVRSGTRRDDLLLTPDESEAVGILRKAFLSSRADDATNQVLDLFHKTRSNGEFVNMVKKIKWQYN